MAPHFFQIRAPFLDFYQNYMAFQLLASNFSVERIIIVSFSLIFTNLSSNPNVNFFGSDAPNVTQISVGTVQVVWHDIVTNYECANDFVVKYCQIEEDVCNVTKPVNKTYIDISDIKPNVAYR